MGLNNRKKARKDEELAKDDAAEKGAKQVHTNEEAATGEAGQPQFVKVAVVKASGSGSNSCLPAQATAAATAVVAAKDEDDEKIHTQMQEDEAAAKDEAAEKVQRRCIQMRRL